MSHPFQAIVFELEHNRKRLNYYQQLKSKPENASMALEKWIDIYADRIKKLEKQATKFKPAADVANPAAASLS